MTKLFVFSDIHGDLSALERCLSAYQRSGASHLLCLGDVLNHGPRNPLPENYQPLQVAEELNQLAERIIAVRGNCDSEVDQALCRFPILSEFNQFLFGTRKVFASHGHTYNPQHLPPLATGDVFVSGHSHVPVAELRDQIYLFNPGSISIPRNGWPASYGLLSEQGMQVLSLDDDQVLLSCNFH